MFKDDKGNVSMMRILALASSCVGFFLCIYGALVIPDSVAMVYGAGLAGLTNVAKAWQKQAENK